MQVYAELFGMDGPLARAIAGYRVRQEQIEMAEAVERALAERATLIAEAGTGTGKTFAYLVPALRSGLRVIVSTGTKNLQDQLFNRDLPLIQKALESPARIALLKGRGNYLCLHRLELARAEGRFRAKEMVTDLVKISQWAELTRSGDISTLNGVDEESPLWPMVTSNTDNCLGQGCDHWDGCHLVEARRKAQEADLVVVNHHLLLSDMRLKEEGFGDLLPSADLYIIDEAHQLVETASAFFGASLSGRQLLELAKDTEAEGLKEAADVAALRDQAQALEKATRDLRLTFELEPTRGTWREALTRKGLVDAMEHLRARLRQLEEGLTPLAQRGKGLESCLRRAEELRTRLEEVAEEGDGEAVHWFETFTKTFTLHRTPLEIGDSFREQLERYEAGWIFTSATLSVGESFRHFKAQLGIEADAEARWESPFDFRRQAVLYCPEGMGDPRESEYTDQLIEQVLPVLEASGGRAFLLFTSHRALRRAAALLEGRTPYPLLIQGEGAKHELLHRFRELGNAVLLGTSSFWEGVDVRGEALSLVVIDKLPFASPGDPVLQARIDAMKEKGENAFRDYQLPHAVITLKQGVGRLIRDVRDRGVLMLCDPRLFTKSYGRVFLQSLPPMTKTRKLEVVQRFFQLPEIRPATADVDGDPLLKVGTP